MAVSPVSGPRRRKGQELLHQQCWNWGRDIVRPEGNLLLEAGFLKRRPPGGAAGSSCYTLALPDGDSKPDMIPTGHAPPSLRIPVDLTVAAIRRIAEYEEWVLARCGPGYRRAVLRQWKRTSGQLPRQTLPQAWRSLADAIDGKPHREPVEKPDLATHAFP